MSGARFSFKELARGLDLPAETIDLVAAEWDLWQRVHPQAQANSTAATSFVARWLAAYRMPVRESRARRRVS